MKLIEAVSYIEDIRNNEPRGLYITALTYAVDSMEKQIAKKPIILHKETATLFQCPKCSRVQSIRYEQYYCKSCGQKLDWSDEK